MKYLLQQSRLQHLIKHRNGYLLLAMGSILLNLMLVLALFYSIGRERIVLVPPEIDKSFWITPSKVSPEYLSEMVIFLNSLNFNITPSNAKMQHAILLRYVEPDYYSAVKMKFVELEEKIKKEHLTISFQTNSVKVDTQQLIAEVTGDLKYMVGDMALPIKNIKFHWKFNYSQGRLRIISFPEMANHA